MKQEGRSPEEQTELEKFDYSITGEEEEEKLFENLRNTLTTSKVQNTIVINGWEDKGSVGKKEKENDQDSSDREQREFDFLIVSDSLKAVIHIEVKKTFTEDSRAKAAQQLQSGMSFFKEKLPFPQEEDWKYVRVMYFGNQNSFICKAQKDGNCQHFVIFQDTDMVAWWQKITQMLQSQDQRAKEINSYIQACKFLLHQMFQQEQCTTHDSITEDSEKNIEAICKTEPLKKSSKEFCFLTKVQFSIFHDESKKRVAFTSPYGTGKTTLLKCKAKELLSKNSQVTIVLFDDQKATSEFLLKASYDVEFQSLENVTIDLVKQTGIFVLISVLTQQDRLRHVTRLL